MREGGGRGRIGENTMKILFARRVEERRLSYLRSTPLIVNLLNARLSTPGGGGNWHNHRLASGRRHFRVYYLSLVRSATYPGRKHLCKPSSRYVFIKFRIRRAGWHLGFQACLEIAVVTPPASFGSATISAHVPLVKIHGHRVKCYIFVVRTSADFDRGSRIFFKILRNGRKVLMNERAFRFWRDTFCVSYL